MCNISYGCHGIQDKHKWCSSLSHCIPNSTTYTCHGSFRPLAMTSISDVLCDKHKLNLIHLSQSNPTKHQMKQNFSKNSVMYLTHFCKKILNTTYERQLWFLCIGLKHSEPEWYNSFHSNWLTLSGLAPWWYQWRIRSGWAYNLWMGLSLAFQCFSPSTEEPIQPQPARGITHYKGEKSL